MLGRSLPVVVAVCLFLVAESDNLSLDDISNACRDEHHLLQEQVSELKKTKKVESNDQSVKCFIKCLVVGLDIMTEDGEITPGNPSGMKYNKVFPCKNVTGTDTCDKAVNLRNCMWRMREKEERDEAE